MAPYQLPVRGEDASSMLLEQISDDLTSNLNYPHHLDTYIIPNHSSPTPAIPLPYLLLRPSPVDIIPFTTTSDSQSMLSAEYLSGLFDKGLTEDVQKTAILEQLGLKPNTILLLMNNTINNGTVVGAVDALEWDPSMFYRHSMLITLIFCVAYLFVFVVGLVGNCFVIAVVFRSPRMRTVTNFFIVNLAFADILVIVFCLPATLMSNIYVPWVLGWLMCKTVPYIQGVSVAASVYSLIAVSLDRFLAIWWPLKCQITKSRARIMIMIIWLVATTTTIPWVITFQMVGIFVDEPDVQLCIEVWPPSMNGSLYFLIANLLLCYIVPMILITMCYVLIWIKVWRRNIPTDTKDAHMERLQQKSKVKVVKMLVAVVILFVLSWMPLYVIFARIKLFGDSGVDDWEDNILQIATPIAQWLGASNSCINPILYAFFNKKFRRGFMAIVRSRRCCGRLRYYETVAMMSSSTSMRKSSHFYNNSTKRIPPVVPDHAVSYIYNHTGV